MSRVLLTSVLMVLLAGPAMAQEACGVEGGVAVFPGLGGGSDIFDIADEPEPEADMLPGEGCGDAILMDVEPRPGMLVELVSPPKAEELVCTVTSEVISTYRARHGTVDYLLAPDAALPVHNTPEGGGAFLRIAHVITDDPDYVSPEGLRVGDTAERALAVVSGGVFIATGGLCLRLPSGWTACFDPEGAAMSPGGVVVPSPGAPIRDFHLM